MSNRVNTIENLLVRCNDAEVLELHRIVARRAQAIRLRDPEYLARYEMGKRAAGGYGVLRKQLAAQERASV